MKLSPFALLAGGVILLSACATEPVRVYGPGPEPTGAATSGPVSLEGKIAQCGHRGAEEATAFYPEGWQQRLGEVAQKSMANDELLGGPVTTEVVDRNAQPVEPPSPAYPAGPASRGVEAQCYGLFDVTTDGTPEEILTACSSPEFNAPTYQAVKGLRFAPKRVEGRAVRRMNVVYPVTYCLDGQGRR
ncbi:energy transducer TonB [Henriciella aquimarina]|uniref:energy transducer TonB n=1 Tax=Henriciella aquimarina TaxID=545261 RepID=UPI000A0376C9|nr:energy transducer TonB [Henriciella aquimarina]